MNNFRTNAHNIRVRNALAVAVIAAVTTPLDSVADDKVVKGLEEVIVTARKTEENIQSIPVAITSLSSNDMEKAGVFNVRDIGQQTPSLNVGAIPANPATPRLSLRGQVQNETVFTADPSVGVYLDDIYLGRAQGAMLDLYDVQRVEVLKGPQGTLYGRNTTGGALKIITNKADPSADVGGYAKVGFGNYNAKRLETGINIPLVQDTLALRVSGLMNKRDGYGEATIVSPPTGLPIDKVNTDNKDTEAVRIDFLLHATDALEIELSADYSDIQTNGGLNYNEGGDIAVTPLTVYTRSSNDPFKAATSLTPFAKNRGSGAALSATYALSDDLSAKLVYAHRRQDGGYAVDVDGTALASFDNLRTDGGSEQDSVELQLTGNSFEDLLDWTAGLYWFTETGYDTSFPRRFVGDAFDFNDDLRASGENTSKSAYGQGSFHFTDSLSLTVGARYTEDSRDAVSHRLRTNRVSGVTTCRFANVPGIVDLPSCTSKQSADFDHVSWTIGLDWQVLDDVLVYAKTSDGYRAGGVNFRAITAATLVPFDEEKVRDIELGVKSTLWDNRLRANVATYHSDYKGIQNSIVVGTDTLVLNLTDATIDGTELELTAQLLDELVVTLSGSYTDVQFDSPTSAAAIATFPQGLQAAFTPRWQYTVGGTWTEPLAIGDLSFNLNYVWRDEMFGNNSKLLNQAAGAESEAVGLVNARVSLELKNIDTTVSLWATNLTDEQYSVNTLSLKLGTAYVFLDQSPQEPRMFGLDITKRF